MKCNKNYASLKGVNRILDLHNVSWQVGYDSCESEQVSARLPPEFQGTPFQTTQFDIFGNHS
jgi:hypothetical protein